MKDQIIITMGREHGSGGHYIADMIARELGIKLYDKDSIESEIVSEGYSEELIRRMDEKPVNFFASRRRGAGVSLYGFCKEDTGYGIGTQFFKFAFYKRKAHAGSQNIVD